jgi:hypothetical protein
MTVINNTRTLNQSHSAPSDGKKGDYELSGTAARLPRINHLKTRRRLLYLTL